MNGLVFNIQRFCIQDGPGIRTTVFLKGCPLRCAWCHNPESHSREVEVMHENGKAEICGTYMTTQEIMDEVLKDQVFYENSGGGLTLSGGEPLMQADFIYELLKTAKQKRLHTCMETCGFAPKETVLKIAEFTDLFLYDWKITDEKLHEEYTGVNNKTILENLKAIDAAGKKIVLRCPIIPGINDTQDHFLGIANVANAFENILAVEIEPYHSLGTNKYIKLGKADLVKSFAQPTEQQTENWIAQIQKQTTVVVKKA